MFIDMRIFRFYRVLLPSCTKEVLWTSGWSRWRWSSTESRVPCSIRRRLQIWNWFAWQIWCLYSREEEEKVELSQGLHEQIQERRQISSTSTYIKLHWTIFDASPWWFSYRDPNVDKRVKHMRSVSNEANRSRCKQECGDDAEKPAPSELSQNQRTVSLNMEIRELKMARIVWQ